MKIVFNLDPLIIYGNCNFSTPYININNGNYAVEFECDDKTIKVYYISNRKFSVSYTKFDLPNIIYKVEYDIKEDKSYLYVLDKNKNNFLLLASQKGDSAIRNFVDLQINFYTDFSLFVVQWD